MDSTESGSGSKQDNRSPSTSQESWLDEQPHHLVIIKPKDQIDMEKSLSAFNRQNQDIHENQTERDNLLSEDGNDNELCTSLDDDDGVLPVSTDHDMDTDETQS